MTFVDQLADRIREHSVNLSRRALDTTVEETKAAASRRTGAMADAIHSTEPELADSRVVMQIRGEEPYTGFQDVGTGLYGPAGVRIFPTTAKALRFDWPAAGGIVFAKSIAGSPGRHFFSEPLPSRWHDALAGNAGGPI